MRSNVLKPQNQDSGQILVKTFSSTNTGGLKLVIYVTFKEYLRVNFVILFPPARLAGRSLHFCVYYSFSTSGPVLFS